LLNNVPVEDYSVCVEYVCMVLSVNLSVVKCLTRGPI